MPATDAIVSYSGFFDNPFTIKKVPAAIQITQPTSAYTGVDFVALPTMVYNSLMPKKSKTSPNIVLQLIIIMRAIFPD